jgi:hypothetical protein
MDSLRVASRESVPHAATCCRCEAANSHWDRIAGTPYCPNCQEMMIQGEGAPLVLKTEKRRCAVCDGLGTVCYMTFPLQAKAPVEIEMCPRHLRALLGRCLEPHAFHQLRRKLQSLGLKVDKIFLLHETFYDTLGKASLPAMEME